MSASPLCAVLTDHPRGPSVVLSLNDQGAYVVVNEDGSTTLVAEEAFLVAMGGLRPEWWDLVSGVLVVSEHHPGLSKDLVLHYLARPFGDRQVLVRTAFEDPAVVAPWLWLMFALDPHRSVRQTMVNRISGDTVWTPLLVDAVIVWVTSRSDRALRERLMVAWDGLPKRLQAHVMQPGDTSQEWADWRGRAAARVGGRSPLFNSSPRSP